jgi:hypothetical protein
MGDSLEEIGFSGPAGHRHTEDRHNALQIVGQHVERHLGGDVFILKCVVPTDARRGGVETCLRSSN